MSTSTTTVELLHRATRMDTESMLAFSEFCTKIDETGLIRRVFTSSLSLK